MQATTTPGLTNHDEMFSKAARLSRTVLFAWCGFLGGEVRASEMLGEKSVSSSIERLSLFQHCLPSLFVPLIRQLAPVKLCKSKIFWFHKNTTWKLYKTHTKKITKSIWCDKNLLIERLGFVKVKQSVKTRTATAELREERELTPWKGLSFSRAHSQLSCTEPFLARAIRVPAKQAMC